MSWKRRNFAITALGSVLIIAWILVTSQRAADPVQDGRHLSEWVLLLSPAAITRQRSLEEVRAQQEASTAIRALGTNALPYLIQALNIDERSSRFRGAAGWLLTRVPFLQQIDPLQQWVYGLGNFEFQRAGGAFRAFEILGVTAQPAIPELTQLANSHTNWITIDASIGALAAIGPPGQSALVGIIATNRNVTVRAKAIGCLTPGEPAAASVPLLIELLRDPSAAVVRAAVRALGRIQAHPELTVRALTDHLRSLQPARPASGLADEELMLKREIVLALDSFGGKSNAAVPVLIAALQDASAGGSLACHFITTLVNITQDPALIVPVLTDQVERTEGWVRACAAMGLANLGASARSALPALTNALQHADTRQPVEYAIQQITSPPKTNTPTQ